MEVVDDSKLRLELSVLRTQHTALQKELSGAKAELKSVIESAQTKS